METAQSQSGERAEAPKPIMNQVPRPKDPLQLMAKYDMAKMPRTWRSKWFGLAPERRVMIAVGALMIPLAIGFSVVWTLTLR